MKRAGFTLIELSIVLVIIGLIIGGILFGKEMIKYASLRKIYTQSAEFASAVNTFKLKYSCLPGDCARATTFFGTDPEGCDPTTLDKTAKKETCNGNGDGMVGDTGINEPVLIWQHLASAGLIVSAFSGSLGSVDCCTPDINFPGSTVGGWWQVDAFDGIIIGRLNSSAFSLRDSDDTPLLPVDAMSLDSKYDDGFPYRGSIQSYWGDMTLCTTGAFTGANFTERYDITKGTPGCTLSFSSDIPHES